MTGRAWSGWGAIAAVEVSTDDGDSWGEARVAEPELGRWAWQSWTFEWEPMGPGDYVLSCRARDTAGNNQGDQPGWNVGGYANPAPQRVLITLTD